MDIPYIFDDIHRVECAEKTALPEHEKNDGLDRKELQERLVLLDLIGDGEVELDQAEHGHRDGDGDNDEDL